MKQLLILGFVLGCAANLPPAAPNATPMPQANIVQIYTSQSSEEAYASFGAYLAGAGFTISHSDATLKIINTDPLNMEIFLSPAKYSLQASILSNGVGSIIQVRGTLHMKGFKTGYTGILTTTDDYGESQKVKMYGLSGSPLLVSWERIVALCTSYPLSSQIMYARN